MQLCCLPLGTEMGMTKSPFRIKALLLSSPTSLIGDPEVFYSRRVCTNGGADEKDSGFLLPQA